MSRPERVLGGVHWVQIGMVGEVSNKRDVLEFPLQRRWFLNRKNGVKVMWLSVYVRNPTTKLGQVSGLPSDWQIPSCHVTTQTLLHFRTEEYASFVAETAVEYCQRKLNVRATAVRNTRYCFLDRSYVRTRYSTAVPILHISAATLCTLYTKRYTDCMRVCNYVWTHGTHEVNMCIPLERSSPTEFRGENCCAAQVLLRYHILYT